MSATNTNLDSILDNISSDILFEILAHEPTKKKNRYNRVQAAKVTSAFDKTNDSDLIAWGDLWKNGEKTGSYILGMYDKRKIIDCFIKNRVRYPYAFSVRSVFKAAISTKNDDLVKYLLNHNSLKSDFFSFLQIGLCYYAKRGDLEGFKKYEKMYETPEMQWRAGDKKKWR